MEVFCSQRKASGSLRPIFSMSSPLARSTRLRVSKRSCRSEISFSRDRISSWRDRAISRAGIRSAGVKGLTT